MHVTTIGIDLAKNSLSVRAVDSYGKQVFSKTLSRGKLLQFPASNTPQVAISDERA
jgi:hypothetical protein